MKWKLHISFWCHIVGTNFFYSNCFTFNPNRNSRVNEWMNEIFQYYFENSELHAIIWRKKQFDSSTIRKSCVVLFAIYFCCHYYFEVFICCFEILNPKLLWILEVFWIDSSFLIGSLKIRFPGVFSQLIGSVISVWSRPLSNMWRSTLQWRWLFKTFIPFRFIEKCFLKFVVGPKCTPYR